MPLLFHLHQLLHHILELGNVYLKYSIFVIMLLNNSHTKILSLLSTNTPKKIQITVINVTKKLPILIQNLDTGAVSLWRQDMPLAVCCDATGLKLLFSHRIVLGNWGMTGVSPSEYPVLIDHHYSTSVTNSYYWTNLIVSYTDVIDSVLSDVFNFRIRWVQRFTFFVILNLLFLCRSWVTEIFGLSVIMMEHGHQKITNKTDTRVKWHPPFQWDQLFCLCILYFINCTCFPNNIHIIFITVYSCIIRKISWIWLSEVTHLNC